MPIYEFRCLSCNHIFEILSVARDAADGVRCPQCGGEEAERLISRVACSMGDGSARGAPGPVTTTRSCGEGSCGSITLPGHMK
jgi:putative FmdB family regulatory protein